MTGRSLLSDEGGLTDLTIGIRSVEAVCTGCTDVGSNGKGLSTKVGSFLATSEKRDKKVVFFHPMPSQRWNTFRHG